MSIEEKSLLDDTVEKVSYMLEHHSPMQPLLPSLYNISKKNLTEMLDFTNNTNQTAAIKTLVD